MKNSYFRKPQKCWYNDNGFCKYGQECKKIHFKAICFRRNCERKCEGRHPKLCRFEEKCRFLKEGICAFKHVTHANDDQEIKALKIKMEHLETENKNLKNKVKDLEYNIAKEDINKKELTEKIKGKNSIIQESKGKLLELEDIGRRNKNEMENLVEQSQQERCEIDQLKADIDELEMKVWNEEEDYKNLMFLKECVQEDFESEKEKMGEEIKAKNVLIKEQNEKIKIIELKIDSVNSEENVCDKCYFKGKSENNLKVHMNKEHKFRCELCEYKFTTKLQLSQHAIKEHQ